jgi:Uma2 family endonuclease
MHALSLTADPDELRFPHVAPRPGGLPQPLNEDEERFPHEDPERMGQSGLHFLICLLMLDFLRRALRGRQACLLGDVFVYSDASQPQQKDSPDIAVVLGATPEPRRVWKTWEEGRFPDLIIEVISDTEGHELGPKLLRYARMGVVEYLIIDPELRQLATPMWLWRREGDALQRVTPRGGLLELTTVRLRLGWAEGMPTAHDSSGQRLLDLPQELEQVEARLTREVLVRELRISRVEEERDGEAARRLQAEAERKEAEARRQEAEAQRQEAEAQQQAEAARRREVEAELAELRRALGAMRRG